MKLLLLTLLSSTSALTSIRRLVENNADTLMQLQNDLDLSCTLSMAEDAESCESVSDAAGNNCVWCPIGNELGSCVPQDAATFVNMFGIPHLHCGPQDALTLQNDEAFFSELEACGTGGFNGDACGDIEGSSCQYCVTKDDPTFGICFSEEFVSEAIKVVDIAKQFDMQDDVESWDEVFNCDATDKEALKVGSIADMECVANGNPEQMFGDIAAQCSETKDASGKACVVANLFGFMDVCVSSTQQTVIDFLQQELNDLGIDDPIGMVMSSSLIGGDEELKELEKVAEFDEDHGETDADYVDDESNENEATGVEPADDGEDSKDQAEYAETTEGTDEDTKDDEPEIVVEYEDFIVDEPEPKKTAASPNDMIAGIMNTMEERKEAADESGK